VSIDGEVGAAVAGAGAAAAPGAARWAVQLEVAAVPGMAAAEEAGLKGVKSFIPS